MVLIFFIFNVNFGSFGPGIIPISKTFSLLYRNERGRFCTTRYIAPTEYSVVLKYHCIHVHSNSM